MAARLRGDGGQLGGARKKEGDLKHGAGKYPVVGAALRAERSLLADWQGRTVVAICKV